MAAQIRLIVGQIAGKQCQTDAGLHRLADRHEIVAAHDDPLRSNALSQPVIGRQM
jgi:hypothetical protein